MMPQRLPMSPREAARRSLRVTRSLNRVERIARFAWSLMCWVFIAVMFALSVPGVVCWLWSGACP